MCVVNDGKFQRKEVLISGGDSGYLYRHKHGVTMSSVKRHKGRSGQLNTSSTFHVVTFEPWHRVAVVECQSSCSQSSW